MDKYTEVVKEIQRGNQEARNMLENQLKQDYQYMVANVNDLAQAEGLLRSAIASAMANITPTSSPDGIGESVRRNLEWNLTRASQVRRDYNQGNNYDDETVTFSQSGTYRMNNNPQGGYAGSAGYQNNGYGQQNNINNGAGYRQQNNINNGAGYRQQNNINNGAGYRQQNNINNAARPQAPSNAAPKTNNNKKNFIKYALIGAGIPAIIIIVIVLYNVFFKDKPSSSSGGNSTTEDYSYQDDTEDTSYNDTETSDNNIASDTGYEIVIEDYFYYYSNEDAEGMKLCYLDCIRDSMEKDMYSSVSGANSMDDYWQVMENGYGSDFVISAEIKSVDECDPSTIAGLEAHVQTTYGGTVNIDRAVIANLHETCKGSLQSYSFDESIYVAYINGAWYMIGTVLQ